MQPKHGSSANTADGRCRREIHLPREEIQNTVGDSAYNHRNTVERETILRGESMNKVRCAIYCRKSVEKGLDMEFSSIDAQRKAGEAYVASQKANGWVCLPERYDDGGFSGGNLNRPALQ